MNPRPRQRRASSGPLVPAKGGQVPVPPSPGPPVPKIVARMRLYRGAPTIFVNGRPIHGGFVGTRGGSHFLAAKPEGVVPLTFNGTGYQMVFVGPGGAFDIDKLEADMAQLFEENPQAFGGVVLGLRPNNEWIRNHLDQMPVAAWPIDWLTDNRPDASWASEVWRRDSVAAVELIAGRLHAAFNGRVIFYQIGAGRCGENGPQVHIDSSPPMLGHLRAWLRERYGNDVAALRRYWSDPKVTFESAMPPDDAERLASEWFAFRSPFRRRTADYFNACSICVETNVALWCGAVKRATNGESLTASPGASVLDTGLHTNLHGHLPKNTVAGYLATPELDMVESPASYTYRDLGRGDTTVLQPMGSVQLAGKMQMRDFDTRTSLTAWKGEEFPKCRLWQPPKDPWGDVQVLVRDTAYSLMKNSAFWWHELERDMYSLPQHVAAAKRLQAVGRGAVYADRRMVGGGMAVFVQPEANFLQSSSNRLIFTMNYEARQFQWAHAGMASNIFCLHDASHPDMPAPKVILVTNAFTMTDRQAKDVVRLARKNNATIVWSVAPGIQTADGFDLEHTSRITGFKIRALDAETLPRITMLPGEHPWSQVTWPDERPVESFGGGPFDYDDSGARGIGPTFYVDIDGDPGATVLGELDFINQPGLVVRQCRGYRSVYCAAPYLHKSLLRRIGADSGAHVYLDTDDLVHASRELLVVNARRAGVKEFHWPRKVQVVVDLYSGRTVAENTKSWRTKLKKFETRFLFAGTAKVAEKVRQGMKSRGGYP